MVTATEQHEIAQPRRSSIGPMLQVVRITDAKTAAWEAAAAIAVLERPPDRGWYHAHLTTHIKGPALPVLHHDNFATITGDAPRRFRGNVHASENGLAGVRGFA